MTSLTIAIGLMAMSAEAHQLPCTPSADQPVQIHWSETKKVFSPSCKWVLEIHSIGTDGPARVFIRKTEGGPSHFLFGERRDAEVHWEGNDTALIVRDMQFSDRYNLLLFDPLDAYQGQEEALRVNSLIRQAVKRELKPRDNITYYLPDLVQWQNDKVVVSVGVVTVSYGGSGPFTPHCFGYEIGLQSLKIEKKLSQANLKTRFAAACQTWP